MGKRVLIALDLEGVNNVVGVPYSGLAKGTPEWEVARRQAVREVNTAASVLFDLGADRVSLWDNHGGGGNVNPILLDTRVELLAPDLALPRMYFGGEYDLICYFGYHTMEGTLGGVLAHTMNSTMNQHYKLNGKYIGEVDMDAYIAASHGVPSVFFAAGDIACAQARRAVPDIVTVVTKREISRNEAEFRDNDELLCDIERGITEAYGSDAEPHRLAFPATFEKSFKRVEDAASYLARLELAGIEAAYPCEEILGKDAHTVVSKIYTINDFITCI